MDSKYTIVCYVKFLMRLLGSYGLWARVEPHMEVLVCMLSLNPISHPTAETLVSCLYFVLDESLLI
jgi:hypothetical protein